MSHGADNAQGHGGTFIVIEGTDGSGKGTQYELLAEHLRSQGYDVATFDFPQYGQPSSYFIQQYLNGEYGSAEEVGPYTGSLFYALDRYEAAPRIREALAQGKIVLANRFVGSNMGHQGTKFAHAEERRGYFIWLDSLEHETLKIPRPNLSLVLHVPAEIAQGLVDQKKQRSYTDKKRDLHEADLDHMQKAVAVYDELCQLFPNDFQRIDCVRDGNLLDKDTIQDIIRQKITPLLPPGTKNTVSAANITRRSTEMNTQADNPYVSEDKDGTQRMTEAGREYLKDVVTNADSKVYAFTNKLSPITIAAAMARLSRRPGDMRLTILDEFAHKIGKDEKLLQRIITGYGDDSVQQLTGLHLAVEGASQILTKKLEWGRLASYLEQSTRYIYYDQKDEQGNYSYYTPDSLQTGVRRQYRTRMDQIFDLYAAIAHGLADYIAKNSSVPQEERDAAWKNAVRAQACDAARPVLPVAVKSTVGIFASGQALESLITHLASDELPEARQTGDKLLAEARKVIPAFLERADKPDRGGATAAYRNNTFKAIKQLANNHLPARHASSDELDAVQLTDVWPRNELDLVADMLYEHSNLPLEQIRKEVASWAYNKKLEVFQTYMGERLNRRHKPGRALEKAHYSWDLMCDYGIFRDLQRHRMVDDLEWQELTPRYGYDVPKLIEDAGLVDQFVECFDLSLKLHSLLQEMGYGVEAQYATLLGHKMRWKVTYNAREAFHLHELRTSPQGHPGYRKLVNQMHEKLSEVHPLLGGAMRFVNQGEDPELTRLAAERYTQFKLQQLDQPGEKA